MGPGIRREIVRTPLYQQQLAELLQELPPQFAEVVETAEQLLSCFPEEGSELIARSDRWGFSADLFMTPILFFYVFDNSSLYMQAVRIQAKLEGSSN